jgi:hypothetical protein
MGMMPAAKQHGEQVKHISLAHMAKMYTAADFQV